MAEDKYSSCLLDASTIDMEVGMTTKLSLLYCPEDYGKIEWTANPKNIVSMEVAGNSVNITGLNKGVCTITVNIDGQTLDTSCSVNVTKPYSIEISPEELIVSCGESKKIDYHIKGKNVAGTHVKWKSNCPNVASVSDNGIVTGHTEGEAEITATINVDGSEDSATCQIKVFPPLCTPDTLLITGESRDIRLSLPKDHTLSSATWKITEGTGNLTFISNNTEVTDSNNTEVTEITGTSESVTVKGIAEGMAKVIVLAKVSNSEKEDKDISCEVKMSVHKVAIASNTGTSVNVDKTSSIELTIPEGYTLSSTTWTITDGCDYLKFISNDQQVAEITETRKSVTIKGKSEGTATIKVEGTVSSAEVDNITISCESTIKVLKSDEVKEVVKINQSQLTVPVDKTCTLNSGDGLCLLKGNVIQDKARWKAKDTGIIEIKENKLIPTGVGSTVISASYDGGETYPLSCVVTVPPFFELSQKRTTILVGSEESLHIISKVESSLSYQWTNSNNSAVSCSSLLSDTITLKGSAKGRATITAYVSCVNEGGIVSYSESCDVTVAENQKDAIVERMDSVLSRYDASQMGYALDISFQTNSSTSTEMQPTTLAQGTETEISVKNRVVSLLLTSVQVHKEMYKPGCLEVTLETNAMLSDFCGQVTLHYRPEDNDSDKKYAVASTYHIFEKKKKGRYVTLKAYSVDKFLTIDKFSQAFTGKKLIEDIVNATLKNYKNSKSKIQAFCENVTLVDDKYSNTFYLRHLKSVSTTKSKTHYLYNGEIITSAYKDGLDDKEKSKVKEFYPPIEPSLPYNVQFEESFYDFLVRICNRNGEFLYVEDNKLHIGINIPEKSSVKAIYEYESNGSATGYEIEYTEEEESCDYTTISNKKQFPEEYYKPVRKKDDDFAKNEDYYIGGALSLSLIKPIVESPHIMDAIPQTTMACGAIFGLSEMFKKKANEDFKADFGDYTKGDVYQFVDGNDFGNQFYAEILKNEKLAEREKLIVTSSTYKHHLLGDTVKVDDKFYVVYQIRGGAKIIDGVIESQDIKRYKEEFEMLLLPYIGTETKSSENITSLPYPIALSNRSTRKPTPQRAIVSANKDPMRLGRVRVLFDWQDSEDLGNASPWINMASPMASQESGFMFLPARGDTVLVDFEDGNVENPYVVGSFYREDRLPSYHASTQNGPLVKSITSANGHHLTFTDLPGERFGANLWPFSYFAKFGYLDNLSTTDDNKLGGGFELADYYGFYSITGSTHDRKVSIKSPFGDVSIDAFQGITISAPSGNIKIEGKNVDIIARNNLSITSGTNIANPRFYSNSAAGYNEADKSDPNNSWNVADFFLLKHLLQPMAGAAMKMTIDLSLLRTCFESIFRPIGGTMLIKSHRFMRLEAGKGQTAINSSKGSFKKDSWKQTAINVIKALGNYAFDAKENIVPDNVWTSIIIKQGNIVGLYTQIIDLETLWETFKNSINTNFNSLTHETFSQNTLRDAQNLYLEAIKRPSETPGDTRGHAGLDLIRESYGNLRNLADGIIQHNEYTGVYLNHDLRTCVENFNNNLDNWLNGHTLRGDDDNRELMAPEGQDLLQNDVGLQQKCYKSVYNAIQNIVGDADNHLKDLINMADWEDNPVVDEGSLKKMITISHLYDHKHALRLMGVAAGGMGLTGIMDDRSWSKKDTGNILLSAEAGKMYRFGADGSFKAYMPDEANAWRAFIIKMIRGAKLPSR